MRRVGKQIRTALEKSEKLGRWAAASELTAAFNLRPTTAIKIMRRAVAYGLAEVDESTKPMQFRALPNWRALVEVPGISKGVLSKGPQPRTERPVKPARPKPEPEPRRMFPKAPDRLPSRIINSVWSLGGAYA